MHSKTITLCADDFGLTAEISQSILQLIKLQRLSAVSCMTNRPSFTEEVKKLIPLRDKVQIGLHFNLTDGYFLSQPKQACFDIKKLLVKTHLHLFDPSFIAQEFNAQLDCFINNVGSLPDFIDGHLHVHQLPQIRQVILSLYEKRLRKHGTWMRVSYPALAMSNQKAKAFILAATGGWHLSSSLKKRNIPHMPCFSGIYDLSPKTHYRSLFRQWLSAAPKETLIMCHPGSGEAADDPIAKARQQELAYFLSDAFLQDLEEFHVQLATSPKARKDKTINGD